MSKESKTSLNYMPVLALNDVILSVSVWASKSMGDAVRGKIGREGAKFATTIRLKLLYFGLKLKFNICFKFDKSPKRL